MASLFAGNATILTGKTAGLEPIRKSYFTVTMQDGNGAAPGNDLAFLVKSFSPPARSVEVKSVRFCNHDKSYPGPRSVGEGASVVLRCLARDDSSQVIQFLQNWMDSIYDPDTDAVALIGENYKGQVVLTPVDVSGAAFANCTLVGAWPSSIKLEDSDADDDGNPLNFTVIFQHQDVDYEF